MIIKWILKNWLGIITAVGIIYGIIFSTYNFFESRRGKTRRLKVRVSGGWPISIAGELSKDDMIIIDVINPGERTVTIQTPYLMLPDKRSIVSPFFTDSARYPYELHEGKNCHLWMKRKEVLDSLLNRGYKGKVRIKGAVEDLTGKVYMSKTSYKIKIEAGGLAAPLA